MKLAADDGRAWGWGPTLRRRAGWGARPGDNMELP